MSGKSGSSTTVVKNLPDYASGYVQQYLNKASSLSKEAYAAYTGVTYADQNTNEKDGITRIADRGRNGNQTVQKGIAHIQDTLDGKYLPGTRTEFLTMIGKATGKPAETFTDRVLSKIGASAYLMGDPLKENMAKKMCESTVTRYTGRASAEIYKKNYDLEKKMQIHALEYGPSFAGESAKDAELLRLAGLYAREYTQGSYEDKYKKWYEEQIAEVKRVEILGNAIRSMVGTQEADTVPYHRASPMVTAAGGALSGAAMGSMIMPGWGTAIGAVVGGIAGLAAGS